MKDLFIPNKEEISTFFPPVILWIHSRYARDRTVINTALKDGWISFIACASLDFFFFFEMLGVTECKISSHKNKYIQYREVYGKFFFYSFSLLLIYYPFGGLA